MSIIKVVSKEDERNVTVVFVRHGQAGGDSKPGELGAPLTALGVKQAAGVARRLSQESFTHIYASDMVRAYATAKAIRRYHRRVPFSIETGIREVEGYHLERRRTPRRRDLVEHLRKERAAVDRFIKKLIRTHKGGDRVLIVAHGNLIRLMIALLSDVNPKRVVFLRLYNTSVSVMTFHEGGKGQKLILSDCVKHLAQSMITNWGPTG